MSRIFPKSLEKHWDGSGSEDGEEYAVVAVELPHNGAVEASR